MPEFNSSPAANPDRQRHVFSVSELNNAAKYLLENQFPAVWLEGEISNLVQPRSGHIYLTLKDDNAQLRCAMFRGNNLHLNFKPKDGVQVLVRGRLSLFTPRGDYQLIIDQMEQAGLGALQRAFEQLKSKLQAEGLFDDARKRPVPLRPGRIGVITSPTGAAIHDILSVLQRRFPLTEIIVYPTLVQGNEAPAQICAAIAKANARQECDVLIVGRGGGSLEDLWSFNDEKVARAIAASDLPVVSAVGHQIDFTIADFVADLRAPTPSAAAELLSADADEMLSALAGYEQWLEDFMQSRIDHYRQRLQWLTRQLKHPGKRLEEHAQRLDELDLRLRQSIQRQLQLQQSHLNTARARLQSHTPVHALLACRRQLETLSGSLQKAMQARLHSEGRDIGHLAQRLNTVSPLNTLGRGYSILQTPGGDVVQNTQQVQPGDSLRARLRQGELRCTVTEIITS
ncbi:MAG: exodeoxyribonuclease VII large subunit [Gammaproteobacteria bacterium]|nr:exodeoxyribonuclease VII large subunit [Gammaproteobacteria bacterium]